MSVSELDNVLQDIKISLLEQKSSILNKSHEFKHEHVKSGASGDEAETVSQELETNISIHLHERDRKALYAIERALAKIHEGSYGECESCGDQIHSRRLQARPFTALCLACMEEQESSSSLIQ